MSWLEDAALKRRSQASSVILFETSDPQRVKQFLEALRGSDFQKLFNLPEGEVQSLVYDPWEGLTNAYGQPVSVGQEEAGPFSFPQGKADLLTALSKADELLKARTTVFVVKNQAERERALQLAVRSWATSDQVYKQRSTVFLFAPAAEALLDDYTKSLVSVVRIPVSLPEERREIVEKIAKTFQQEPEPVLPDVMAGLHLHDAESALLESLFQLRRLDPAHVARFKAELVRKSGVLSISEPRWDFSAVGGYDETKEFIRTQVVNVLAEPERAQAMGIRPPRGILLFGPPGCGKSLIARALAKELRLPFIELRLEDIFRSLVGETEQRLRSAIDIIEAMAPCLVFIDELDRLGHRTDVSTDSGVSRRVFSQLLEWLGDDRRKAIIVGTTNEPEFLDAAMLRAGRLDAKIPLLLPDVKAREEILRVHTSVQRRVPLAKGVSLKRLAEATEFYSGAEVEELVLRAARAAFNEGAEAVSMAHFKAALETFNIDLTDRRKLIQRYLGLAERFCDDRKFLAQLRAGAEGFARAEALKREIQVKGVAL